MFFLGMFGALVVVVLAWVFIAVPIIDAMCKDDEL
jgi:hypothetical protein